MTYKKKGSNQDRFKSFKAPPLGLESTFDGCSSISIVSVLNLNIKDTIIKITPITIPTIFNNA